MTQSKTRLFDRIEVDVDCQLRLSDELSKDVRLLDLSLKGALIQCSDELKIIPGSEVEILLTFADAQPILICSTLRHKRDDLFGFEFNQLTESDEGKLKNQLALSIETDDFFND